ncbi:MAG: nitrate reductase [Clostridia bacterium]|nr:nitrate reductase [Clostridia bacterium]
MENNLENALARISRGTPPGIRRLGGNRLAPDNRAGTGNQFYLGNQVIELWQKSRQAETADVEVDKWVPTTCGYCSIGCGIYLGVKDGKVVGAKGSPQSAANEGRLCVKGLYEWKSLDAPGRAREPMVRRDGQLVAVDWDRALGGMVARLREVLERYGPEGVAIYGSGQLTLEENYALGKLARGVLGTPNLDSNTRLCMASAVTGYIRSFGADGPPGSYEDIDLADCIVLFGCNPAEMHPQIWHRVRYNQVRRGAKLIVADPKLTEPARVADVHLRLRAGANVPLLNGILHLLIAGGMVNKEYVEKHTTGYAEMAEAIGEFTPARAAELAGVPEESIREAARLIGGSGSVTTLFVQGVNQSASASEAVNLICNIHLITGQIGKPGAAPIAVTGQAAAMSAREVGGGPSLVGFRNWQNPVHRREVARLWGIAEEKLPAYSNDIMTILQGIEAGRIRFLWNIATNPAVSLPNQGWVRKLLQKVFLVVQDIFYPMETAAFADVFLPAAQWGEKTGTFTNSERRVNLTRKAVEPPGKAKADLEIFCAVAKELGEARLLPWQGAEEVFEEWKKLSMGRPNDVSGITYERLEKLGGIQWPCPAENHPGTSRLYTDGIFHTAPEYAQAYGEFNHPANKARLWAVKYMPPPEVPDEEFPFWLNTGRMLEHYHSRTKTKRIPELHQAAPEGYAEINPEDARRLGIKDGMWVRLTSRRGWIKVKAKLTDSVRTGDVFVPFHFGDLDPGEEQLKQAANHLTPGEVDAFSKQPLFKSSTCRLEPLD